MSEEKTNSPSRKETFTIRLLNAPRPIRRTTQFCYEAPPTTRSKSPIKRPPTPFSSEPRFQRAPTTYKNPRHKTCQFSPEEIKKSAESPSPSVEATANLNPNNYPPSPIKLATGEQIMKIQRWRENERERKARQSTDLIAP